MITFCLLKIPLSGIHGRSNSSNPLLLGGKKLKERNTKYIELLCASRSGFFLDGEWRIPIGINLSDMLEFSRKISFKEGRWREQGYLCV